MYRRNIFSKPLRFLWVVVAAAGTAAFAQQDENFDCPILDTPPDTYAGMGLGYAPPVANSAAGWDDVSVVEVDAWGGIGRWENDIGGELLSRLHWNSKILQGYDGSSSGYPLTMAYAYLQWSQRYIHGYGLELDASPGLYSALESVGEDFALPLGFTAIKAFNAQFAVFAGLGAYPGFDCTIDPRAGLRWRPGETFQLDLAYPETRLTLSPVETFHLNFGAKILAWPEYGMGDDPRERIRFRESRVYAGMDFDLAESLRLSLQGGYLFSRELEFEAVSEPVDVDDSMFVNLGMAWLL